MSCDQALDKLLEKLNSRLLIQEEHGMVFKRGARCGLPLATGDQKGLTWIGLSQCLLDTNPDVRNAERNKRFFIGHILKGVFLGTIMVSSCKTRFPGTVNRSRSQFEKLFLLDLLSEKILQEKRPGKERELFALLKTGPPRKENFPTNAENTTFRHVCHFAWNCGLFGLLKVSPHRNR